MYNWYMRCFRAGVLTSDPRIVKEARPVPLLTFDEATELAFFGATVLHPSAMQPAMQHSSLDVRVKNSYNRYPKCLLSHQLVLPLSTCCVSFTCSPRHSNKAVPD